MTRTHNALWNEDPSLPHRPKSRMIADRVQKYPILCSTIWHLRRSALNNNCRGVRSLTAEWGMSQSSSPRVCEVAKLLFPYVRASVSSPSRPSKTSLDEVATVFAFSKHFRSTSSAFTHACTSANCCNASWCMSTGLSPRNEVQKTHSPFTCTSKPYKRHFSLILKELPRKLILDAYCPEFEISRRSQSSSVSVSTAGISSMTLSRGSRFPSRSSH